mgnify:CR=1 FL=1
MANALAVIAGGVLGTIFGKALGARTRETVMAALSGSVMFVAVGGVIQEMLKAGPDGRLTSHGAVMFVVSLALGALLGEWMDLDEKFDRFGAFTYSREEDTPAYDFEDQIDEQVKQDRMDILMREQMVINAEQNEQKVGSVIDVLCEDFDPVNDCYFGRSAADAPDIDGKVFFSWRGEGRIAPGSFVKVKVREVVDYDVYGFAMTEKDAAAAAKKRARKN